MGAGATSQSLDLLVSVDEIIVITTAEPTSITDAYSMMKYIYFKDPDKKFLSYYVIEFLVKKKGWKHQRD